VLREFLLRRGHGPPAPVEDERAGGSGALVKRENVGHGAGTGVGPPAAGAKPRIIPAGLGNNFAPRDLQYW
jgi:hypothetical protein